MISPGDTRSVDIEEVLSGCWELALGHSSLLFCILGFLGRTAALSLSSLKSCLLATVPDCSDCSTNPLQPPSEIKFTFTIQNSKLLSELVFEGLKIYEGKKWPV